MLYQMAAQALAGELDDVVGRACATWLEPMQEHIIDAGWQSPRELSLAALHSLVQNGHLRLQVQRTPHLLFAILHQWGFSYQTNNHDDDGTCEILVWREAQTTLNVDPCLQ